MKPAKKKRAHASAPAAKRRYHSPGRRQQSADTVESSLTNGAMLVRGLLNGT